jgi:signal transduction histidine kinase
MSLRFKLLLLACVPVLMLTLLAVGVASRWIESRSADVADSMRQLQRGQLLAATIVVIVTVVVTTVFSIRLTRPVQRLVEAHRRVAAGELDAPTVIHRRDEIGQLADSFQAMQSRLRESQAALTAELDRRSQLVAELEARNTALERFSYRVSHDLKGPLITLLGFVKGLEAEARAGRWDNFLSDRDRILRAGDRLQSLVDDLLRIARLTQPQPAYERIPFEDLVQIAAENLTALFQLHQVQLEYASTLPVVFGDRVQLLEVVQNLLENAAKFSAGQPSPQIEVGCRRDGETWILYVKDNGIGLADADRTRVFDPLIRLQPAIEGHGLGLTLVKQIVELHGGRIWLESPGPGGGTTACFTLPMGNDGADPPRSLTGG